MCNVGAEINANIGYGVEVYLKYPIPRPFKGSKTILTATIQTSAVIFRVQFASLCFSWSGIWEFGFGVGGVGSGFLRGGEIWDQILGLPRLASHVDMSEDFMLAKYPKP